MFLERKFPVCGKFGGKSLTSVNNCVSQYHGNAETAQFIFIHQNHGKLYYLAS